MNVGPEFRTQKSRPSFARTFVLCLGLSAATIVVGGCRQADQPVAATEATKESLALVGQYGEGENLLDISERDGKLFADGRGFKDAALTAKGDGYELAGPTGPVALSVADKAVMLGSERLPRRDTGQEVEDRIRAGAKADIASLRANALKASPPVEPKPERGEELVDLSTLVPNVKIETRYATTNNFMGLPVYEVSGAFLQKPAAEALVRAAKGLEPLGYGIKVFDGYRPWHVTKMFWDATPEKNRMFVADPSQGSRHNRGSAIDMTIYRLDTGEDVEMPGRYDEMSLRSYADYKGGTTQQRKVRDILRREMEKQGFKVYPEEWWHFDHQDWQKYGILNITLTELKARKK